MKMATPTPAPVNPTPVPAPAPVATTTQVAHSWRATARTVFQAALSLAIVLPVCLAALHIPVAGAAAIVVAVCGGITKVMAVPQVNAFIEKYLPFLAAAPKQ